MSGYDDIQEFTDSVVLVGDVEERRSANGRQRGENGGRGYKLGLGSGRFFFVYGRIFLVPYIVRTRG